MNKKCWKKLHLDALLGANNSYTQVFCPVITQCCLHFSWSRREEIIIYSGPWTITKFKAGGRLQQQLSAGQPLFLTQKKSALCSRHCYTTPARAASAQGCPGHLTGLLRGCNVLEAAEVPSSQHELMSVYNQGRQTPVSVPWLCTLC